MSYCVLLKKKNGSIRGQIHTSYVLRSKPGCFIVGLSFLFKRLTSVPVPRVIMEGPVQMAITLIPVNVLNSLLEKSAKEASFI